LQQLQADAMFVVCVEQASLVHGLPASLLGYSCRLLPQCMLLRT
jgi:hypothetical protein